MALTLQAELTHSRARWQRRWPIFLMLISSYLLGCAHSKAMRPRDLEWMRHATVSVFSLGGDDGPAGPGEYSFHGIRIRESYLLDAQKQKQFVKLLMEAAKREDRERAAAARDGATGGVWACLSGSRGIRFEVDGTRFDFFFECDLWIHPVEKVLRDAAGPASTIIVFSPEEAADVRHLVDSLFTKGP